MLVRVGDFLNQIVRPLIALGLAFALVWGFLTRNVPVEAFLGVAGVVFGYWFMQRQTARPPEPPASPPTP